MNDEDRDRADFRRWIGERMRAYRSRNPPPCRLFAVIGKYWEDGVFVIAAENEDEAKLCLGDRWQDDFGAEEIEGATAPGPARILWPIEPED